MRNKRKLTDTELEQKISLGKTSCNWRGEWYSEDCWLKKWIM